MKVTLYMAMTVNGMIAKENGETPWSESEWKSYSRIVKKSGNLVVGRKTYEIMRKTGEFEKIGNPFVVVVSSRANEISDKCVFVTSPQEALSILEKEGFSEVLVGGGGKLNSAFMSESLVDELILDVEPMIFGNGVNLFFETDFEADLKLLDSKKISENGVQLRYSVNK